MTLIISLMVSFASITAIMTLLFVLSMPFSFFGIQYKIKKLILREKMGLVWIKSKGQSFGLPKIVNIDEPTVQFKEKQFPLPQNCFDGVRFWGAPCAMFPTDDAKNPIGLYYHKTDENGELLYDDAKNPVIVAIKPAVGIEPALLHAVITTSAITKLAKDLFNRYKTQIYILGAIAVGIGISLYLSYESFSTTLPAIQDQLTAIQNSLSTTATQGGATTAGEITR